MGLHSTWWASAVGVLSGAASTSPAASNSTGASTASTRQTLRLLDAAILVAPFGKVELSSYQRPRPDPKGNQVIQLEPHNLSGLAGIVYVHVHAAFGSWQEPTTKRKQRATSAEQSGKIGGDSAGGWKGYEPRWYRRALTRLHLIMNPTISNSTKRSHTKGSTP